MKTAGLRSLFFQQRLGTKPQSSELSQSRMRHCGAEDNTFPSSSMDACHDIESSPFDSDVQRMQCFRELQERRAGALLMTGVFRDTYLERQSRVPSPKEHQFGEPNRTNSKSDVDKEKTSYRLSNARQNGQEPWFQTYEWAPSDVHTRVWDDWWSIAIWCSLLKPLATHVTHVVQNRWGEETSKLVDKSLTTCFD